jgi:hypothetical protein
MLRCSRGTGTESTPVRTRKEAARLVSQFVGDLCVVALASDDRRRFGPFASRARTSDDRRDARGVDHASRERAAWPLAGPRADSAAPRRDRPHPPGELEGIVNPAMDATSAASG